MFAIARRRMAGTTALLILLSLLQGALLAPTAGAEDVPTDGPLPEACEKVEDQYLGVEGLEITVDTHISVTFHSWVGTANEYSAVTVDVTGLLPTEHLVWQTKAGSPESGNLETNSGLIATDGTYTITRATGAIKAISHITLCVTDSPEPNTAELTVVKKVVIASGSPSTALFEFELTHQPGFTLSAGAAATFVYELGESGVLEVRLAEVAIAETGWTTSMTCDDGSTGQADVTIDLGASKSVTCTVTNTYRPPSTTTPESSTTVPGSSTTTPTTSVPTTTASVTTQDTPPTTVATTVGAEVLGTTITAAPEVAAVTLPFTGSGTDVLWVLGLLALVVGSLLLFIAPKDEFQVDATEWSRW